MQLQQVIHHTVFVAFHSKGMNLAESGQEKQSDPFYLRYGDDAAEQLERAGESCDLLAVSTYIS